MNPVDSAAAYTLFGTSACHLCELAEEMLVQLRRENTRFDFAKVDISGADELFERYGLRIPVLRDPQGRELGWPFTPQQLRVFVGG